MVTSSVKTVLFPECSCLFCGKEKKWVNGNHSAETLVTRITETTKSTIKECARLKNDFNLPGKIDGVYLRARKARCHPSCRKEYTRRDDRKHHSSSSNDCMVDEQSVSIIAMKASHKEAFDDFFQYVKLNIINGGKVERMTTLRNRYL